MTLTTENGSLAVAFDNVRTVLDGTVPALATGAIMDATAEKIAIVGAVVHPTIKSGTINIRKVHFVVGAKTLDPASVFQVSLQSLSLTAGPPYQPDGTPDQTASLSALTANASNVTGNLSADRAVDLSSRSPGDANSRWLAVVFEFTTFTAADSVIISSNNSAVAGRNLGGQTLLNTGSWAVIPGAGGLVVLECDDGSFAFLRGASPWISFGTVNVASNGSIRRAGVRFRVPTERTLGAAGMVVAIPNGADGRFVLYDSDGTTELESVTVDNDSVYQASGATASEVILNTVLAANTYYRWVFEATTTTAAVVHYGNVQAAGHMDGLILGQDCHWTEYDGSAWTQVVTRKAFVGFGFSAFHNPGGGLIGGGNLSGGLQ